jgi:hypothetical protein
MENERISGNKTLLSLAEKGKKMQWLLSHRTLAFAAPADFVRRSSLQRAKAGHLMKNSNLYKEDLLKIALVSRELNKALSS